MEQRKMVYGPRMKKEEKKRDEKKKPWSVWRVKD